MEQPFGRKLVEDGLEILRDTIREYYGCLNELKAGIKPNPMVEMPDAMYLYEQCVSMKMPLLDGGILDQPVIWLLEWNAVHIQKTIMESLPSLSGDTNNGT